MALPAGEAPDAANLDDDYRRTIPWFNVQNQDDGGIQSFTDSNNHQSSL